MSGAMEKMETAFNSPKPTVKSLNSSLLSTPLFVPPTPMLKQMGYGTGVHIYRIERSPIVGKIRSPWVVKRIRGGNYKDDCVSSRLLTETNILKSLNHPNIVGYRGSKTLNDERIILAMETCDISLGDLLEQREELAAGPLEAQKIKKVSIDVLKALDYLHTKVFLLHGDLKSYNVLIKGSFELCKLCDFGVSLPLNSDGFVDLKKNPNAKYTGTYLWSAPEVFHSPVQDINTKSDMFSFGLIIYECISLKPPHYEHLENPDVSNVEDAITRYGGDTRKLGWKQAKKLFSDTDVKENESAIESTANSDSKNESLMDDMDNSELIKSTVATIGDETTPYLTDTTLNETENSILCKNPADTIGDADNTFESFESDLSMRKPMRDITSLNSTLNEKNADNSMSCPSLDQSSLMDDAANETAETIESYYGSRPKIPDCFEFSDEYKVILETFYICTNEDFDERPTAGDLLKSLEVICQSEA